MRSLEKVNKERRFGFYVAGMHHRTRQSKKIKGLIDFSGKSTQRSEPLHYKVFCSGHHGDVADSSQGVPYRPSAHGLAYRHDDCDDGSMTAYLLMAKAIMQV